MRFYKAKGKVLHLGRYQHWLGDEGMERQPHGGGLRGVENQT